MQVQITARHKNLSDQFKAHANDMIERTLSCFPRVESVHVIMDQQKLVQMAEINVQGSCHIRLDAKAEDENKYQAFDTALERIETQLRKLRDKVQDHHSDENLKTTEAVI